MCGSLTQNGAAAVEELRHPLALAEGGYWYHDLLNIRLVATALCCPLLFVLLHGASLHPALTTAVSLTVHARNTTLVSVTIRGSRAKTQILRILAADLGGHPSWAELPLALRFESC